MSWSIYLAIFVVALGRVALRPVLTNLNIALLFAVPATSIVIGMIAAAGLVRAGPITSAINTTLLLPLSDVLLLLVNDSAVVAR